METSGASDVVFFEAEDSEEQPSTHLFFANNQDNVGSPQLNSPVLRWNGSQFTTVQDLALQSPSAAVLFQVNSQLFMVVASSNDVRSSLYTWRDGEFSLTQVFSTTSASDVVFYPSSDGSNYVIVSNSTGGANVFTFSDSAITPASTLQGSGTTSLELSVLNNTGIHDTVSTIHDSIWLTTDLSHYITPPHIIPYACTVLR